MTGRFSSPFLAYILTGCNSYEGNHRRSAPISFWMEKDIWDYLKKYNVPYSKIYDMGYDRTGCVFCMFGCYVFGKREERFDRLKVTHPTLYDYCMNKLGLRKVLDFVKVGSAPKTPGYEQKIHTR